ncbi:addiction module antitoxin [Enterococcus faecium]|uniref:addiction module antitoxin n=1 Tax=Enterococcus faecium TaxID=1352 RepID=UPI00220D8F5D|nr:addiction module antitoxin [Enterococcus faecium]BDP99125.1 hypothetical protein EfmGK961_29410 [Enterococcus faecium]
MYIQIKKGREKLKKIQRSGAQEFLKENGLHPGDTIFLDKEKIQATIQKILTAEIDVAISQSSTSNISIINKVRSCLSKAY